MDNQFLVDDYIGLEIRNEKDAIILKGEYYKVSFLGTHEEIEDYVKSLMRYFYAEDLYIRYDFTFLKEKAHEQYITIVF